MVSPQPTSDASTETIRLPVDSELNRRIKEERRGIGGRIKSALKLVYEEESCAYHDDTHQYPKLMSSASPKCHENVVYHLALKSYRKMHPDWSEAEVDRKARMAVAMDTFLMTVDDKGVGYAF